MFAEGYAAVTSRQVAAAAGLKPQLVHYYFRTMDDLFLALFRRRSEQGLARQAEALASPQPLWALWDLSRETRGTALTMEFVALAHHRKAVRAEIAASAERFRTEQLAGLAPILKRYGVGADACPALVFTVLLSSVARFLVIEQEALGLTSGHAETVAFVEGWITRLEGVRDRAEPGSPTGLGEPGRRSGSSLDFDVSVEMGIVEPGAGDVVTGTPSDPAGAAPVRVGVGEPRRHEERWVMPKAVVDFPVFDADNHMYETTDAFTKFLPKEYEGLVKYVEVNGRTKIAIRNVISDYIPNPDLLGGRPPRSTVGVLQARQPRGEDRGGS